MARHREASAEGKEQTGASEAVSGREATDVSPAPIAPLLVSLSASCIVAMGVVCVMLFCDGLISHKDVFLRNLIPSQNRQLSVYDYI